MDTYHMSLISTPPKATPTRDEVRAWLARYTPEQKAAIYKALAAIFEERAAREEAVELTPKGA